jgi:hypothetical protein
MVARTCPEDRAIGSRLGLVLVNGPTSGRLHILKLDPSEEVSESFVIGARSENHLAMYLQRPHGRRP